MGRSPCCSDEGLKKGPWTSEEDDILREYIKLHGHGSWRELPRQAGLNRCGKSCRLRWTNYLKPDIKRGKFDEEEEEKIIQLHAEMGNKWSTIASKLPGRTDNEIKNHWNTHLRKKLMKKGIDPVTHKPRPEFAIMAALTAGLQGGNGANQAAFDPRQLQAGLAQWARVQLAESIIQVLAVAAPVLDSPVGSASAQHSSVGATLGGTFDRFPQLQGSAFGTAPLSVSYSGTPGGINGAPPHPTATVAPAATAPATFSLSSFSGLPWFPPQTVLPNLINPSVTPTSTMFTEEKQQQPVFCSSSGAISPQNSNNHCVMDNIPCSYDASGVPDTAGFSSLPAPRMDTLDALLAELDIPNADTSASMSAATVSTATPSWDEGFSNCDVLDGIILEEISSWPSTGYLTEKHKNKQQKEQ